MTKCQSCTIYCTRNEKGDIDCSLCVSRDCCPCDCSKCSVQSDYDIDN